MEDLIEVGDNFWVKSEGRKLNVIQSTPYHVIAFFFIAGILLFFMSLLVVHLEEYGLLTIFPIPIALVIFMAFKTEIVIFDFDSMSITATRKIFNWIYRNQRILHFQTPLILSIGITEDSEGISYSLWTSCENNSTEIMGLNGQTEGDALIRILKSRFPNWVEDIETKYG